MASLERLAGISGFIGQVYMQDSTTGAGKTGLTNSTVTCYYKRDTDTASNLVTLDAITTLGTYQVYATGHGGWREIDSTNMPGHYEFHHPNIAVGSNAGLVGYAFRATGAVQQPMLVGLNAVNNQSSSAFMSSVPTVAGTIGANLLQVNGVAVAPDPTAQAGGASTITLASSDTAATNAYTNVKIKITGGTGAGQGNVIASNVGSTKVATVATAWVIAPDATSTYAIGDTAETVGGGGGGSGPTAAQIATYLFQDLLSSTDFQTANSVGLALANMLGALGSDHKPLLSAATHTGAIVPHVLLTDVTTNLTNGGGSGLPVSSGVIVAGSTGSAVIVSGLPAGKRYEGQHLAYTGANGGGEARTIATQSVSGNNYIFNFTGATGTEAGPFSAVTAGDTVIPTP